MKVSVIIPYKEDRGWLYHAIDSVVTQDYEGEIELILSQSNENASTNFNNGIKRSTGEFIKYLCDDDYLSTNSIRSSIEAIHGHDFIHGVAVNLVGDVEQKRTPKIKNPSLSDLITFNHIHGGTLMYRRDVFDKVGFFDESLDCGEEYEFNLRCLKHGLKLGYSPEVLYYYRRHKKQKSLGRGIDQNERRKKIDQIKNKYR